MGVRRRVVDMAGKPLLCRFGVHSWEEKRNAESGERYIQCRRCGRDNDKITLGGGAGGAFG